MNLAKRLFAIFLIFILCIINFFALITWKNEKKIFDSGTAYIEREEYRFCDTFTRSSDRVIQYFKPQKDYLDAIDIRLAVCTTDLDFSDWQLRVELYDPKGDRIAQSDLNMRDFASWSYYRFEVGRRVETDKEYRLVLQQLSSTLDEPWPTSVTASLSVEDIPENEKCMYNDRILDGNLELIYHYLYCEWYPVLLIFLLDLIIVISFLFGTHFQKKKKNQPEITLLSKLHFLISPVFFYILTEGITGNICKVEFKYSLINLILLFLFYLICIMVLGELCLPSVLMGVGCAGFALIEYYVLIFRGRAFSPYDLRSIKTALTVAGKYTFDLPIDRAVLLQLLILYIVITLFLQTYKLRGNRNWRRIRIVGLGIIGVMIFSGLFEVFLSPLDLWDLAGNYRQMGYLYSMLCWEKYLDPDKPDGYSVEQVKKETEGISPTEGNVNLQPENLIVIMNESFADLEMIDNIETNTELFPQIKSLGNSIIDGRLNVAVMGGGTCDTEWEFLTGNSKFFLPGRTIYPAYCNDMVNSIVQTMSYADYETVALHPGYASNWDRDKVYSNMEFDKFYSLENWSTPLENIRWYASDASAYEQVKQLTRQKKTNQKLFAFLVTIQNHGGYSEENFDNFKSTISLDYEDEYPDVENFLTLINESDKAFVELLNYYSDSSQKTMIVMFGDHYPALDEKFYEMICGKPIEDLEVDELNMLYTVPYYIWSNYKLDMKGIEPGLQMSANYFGSYILYLAGIPLASYNQFLLDMMQDLPVLGIGGVEDSQGVWYEENALPAEYEERINDYHILQYNNMFGGTDVVEEIFSLD